MNLTKANYIFEKISNNDPNFFLAGSARRGKKENLKDIDIIYIGSSLPHIKDATYVTNGNSFTRLKYENEKVDLHLCSPDILGSMLLYFTGSKESNIRLRKKAITFNYTLNRYGLFTPKGNLVYYNNNPTSEKEEYIFKALNETYLEPSERNAYTNSNGTSNTELIFNLKLLGIYHDILDLKFQSKAYHNASEILNCIDNIEEFIETKPLTSIRGIGNSINSKVLEFLSTGKISKLDEMKSICPVDVISILSLEGIGISSLYKFYNELNIKNLNDLKNACNSNLISSLKGFGHKSQEKILNQLL